MAIKGRAQKTLTKIFDGSGVFSIIITNENTSIPISNQGLALNYSATPTDAYVYSGTSILTPVKSNPEAGQYTISVDGENITPGLVSMNGNHASVSNASNMVSGKDSYSINITASGKDFLGNPFTSQKKQVITPLKRGDDATSFWLNVTSSVITKDVKNNMTPSDITVSSVAQSGFSDPREYNAIFKVYYKTSIDFPSIPSYISSRPESSYKIIPDPGVNDIRVEMYDEGNVNLLDVQTVPVIAQANGVISTKIVYTVTDTAVQPNDTANWSNTMPTVGKGQYLWTKTTFYYTDGSNAVAYSMGSNGKDGASAALLTLVADSQIVTFDSDGSTPIPASQTITLTAILQNLTGTATFVATPYSGTAAGTPVTLGGTGNVRTLTASQFGSQYDSISVKATLGNLSDTETIHKLTKGEPGDPGPKGTDGQNGSDGATGPKGTDGKTTYVHIAYANSIDGKTDFSTTDNVDKLYIGVLTDEVQQDSTDYTKYTWSLFKGADGADGTPGPKGVDGRTPYIHFAYANSSDGRTSFSVTDPTGRAYVGTLTDYTVADSTDPTKYTWSLIKGADGTDGKNGINSYSGWLTNESITLQADSNGNVPSFTSATGSFVVYNGLTQVTGLTITQANASGITVSLSGMNYSVTGMSADTGYVDLSVTTGGITIIKRLTVAKSKAGATGANGTSVVNSTTPPKNPTEGQWWNDLSVIPNILKVYQKGVWIPYRIDAINLVAGSVKTGNLAADVLLASNVKYTNSNGTTTNLQTFDFDGIKTLLTDTHGNTYSSMDNAVSSTQSWTSLSKQVNNLGQVNQLFNTEFIPDFAGWYSRGNSISVGIQAALGTPFHGSNTFAKIDDTTTRLQLSPIAVIPGTKISYSVQKLVTSNMWSYINNVDANGNMVNVPGTSSPEFGAKYSVGYTKVENIEIPDGVSYISFGIYLAGVPNGNVFSQPMLVFSESVGTYAPGQYNNNARVLKIEKSAEDFQISIGRSVKDVKSSADSANTKVDNLSVGGRNLLLNSTFTSGFTSWNNENNSWTIDSSTYQGNPVIKSPSTTGSGSRVIQRFTNPPASGTKVTVSFNAKGNDTNSVVTVILFGVPQINVPITPSFSRYTVSFTIPNGFIVPQIYFWNNVAGNNVFLNSIKVETGNTPTDWNPAPEDVQAGITSAQTSADTANQNLANASKSGIRYIRLRSEGNNENASTHFSEIKVFNSSGTNVLKGKPALLVNGATNTQSASGATDESYSTYIDLGDMRNSEKYVMFDMGTLRYDINSVQISTWASNRIYYGVVAQTSTDGISWSTIYRGNITPNQLIYGVPSTFISFGMDTSTVLKLTADNYTLGIDANGNLISGISGNKQQVTLRGNAINLDGNTNVTGDFYAKGGSFTNINIANVSGSNPDLIKSNFDSAYGNVSITPTNITLQSYNGTSLMTELAIGSMGISIKMPGVPSFLDSTLINANGMSFQHNNGSYATVGVMDAGFTPDNNIYGGSPMSIRIGDGVHNTANEMTFAISAAQDNGTSPQLIWAGSRVGKITTKYRTWNNPAGFILADNIKFSTWDDTASRVEIDDTVNFYNYAPVQVYGQRFTDGTTRTLHLGGKDYGAKWFGFLDGGDQAGFGTDNTYDVIFFMKGKRYSLYTMLDKLGMR